SSLVAGSAGNTEPKQGMRGEYGLLAPLQTSGSSQVDHHQEATHMLPDILKPTENACLNTSDDHAPLILVVEDHEDTRSLYCFVLESRNFLVAIAVDGEQAVKLAKEKKPHLILMDTNLPGMDGVMAAREIREFDGDGHIPII